MDRTTKNGPVNPYFTKTGWDHVKPCGSYFNEQLHFEKAKQCSDVALRAELNVSIPEDLKNPKCFVVTKESPDVVYSPPFKMNSIILRDLIYQYAVVGLYVPETETIFLVENYDLPKIYRHELQHYFQFRLDPKAHEKNHEGAIWSLCEPKTYTPSEEQRQIIDLQNKISKD